MKTSLFTAVAIALLACSPVAAHDTGGHEQAELISVSGTGDASRAPDMATVSAGVVSEALTAQDAMQKNAAAMSKAFEELRRAGIQEKHITTSQMSLHPQYKKFDNATQSRGISGYSVRNTVSAKTYDMENVGPMLDALVKAGVNNINGVNFGMKNSEDARSEARIEAVKKARAKAQEMAAAAGVRLGRIKSMNESGGFSPPAPVAYARGAAFSAAESTPISAGEQTLRVTVNMVFEIEQ